MTTTGKVQPPRPLTPEKLADLGYLDARSKLLDVAAFLDRIDRAGAGGDFRVDALKQAFVELASAQPGRARRILESLSDPTNDPAPKATTQSACGAPPPPTS